MNEQIVSVAGPEGEAGAQESVHVIRAELMPCVDESIHMPGSIQPHGFLLGLDAALDRVVFASENTESFLVSP